MKTLIRGAVVLALLAGCGGGAGDRCETDLDCGAGFVCGASNACEPEPDGVAPIVVTSSVLPEVAGVGTGVTVTFRVDESLVMAPEVLVRSGIFERAANLTSEDQRDYVFTYVAVGDEPEGIAGIHVRMEDLAGNQADDPLGSVTFDFTGPVVGSVAVNGNGRVGTGITGGLTVTVGEPLAEEPTVQFTDGTPLVFSPTPTPVFSYSYTPTGLEMEGPNQVMVMATDVAGNVTNAGPFDAFTFEFTPPDVSGVPVVSPSSVDTDDVLTLSISFDEVLLENPVIQLLPMGAGATLNLFVDTVSPNGLDYGFVRTIQSTDPTDTYTVRLVSFRDEAQNSGTPRDLGIVTRQ